MKEIDVNMTVYDITTKFPELMNLLADMGFLGVKNPILRNTLGKVTTLKQGCEKQGKNINEIINKLIEKGYKVVGI